MRKLLLPAAALLALAACNQAKNEAAEANEAVAGDSNTMGEAVSDVDAANAAMDNAFTSAENAYSEVPAGEGNAADEEIVE